MPDPRLERPYWRGRTNVDAVTIHGIERAEQIGGHEFVITQGSYQAGAGEPLSAGTHDRGGVVDLRWCGHSACIRALRVAGFAAWHRTPAQGPWPDHVHAVGIGHPYLAPAASRQVDAYRAGRNGLASNGPDDGPRIDPIPSLQWPPEDDMNADDWKRLSEMLDASEDRIAEKVTKRLLSADLFPKREDLERTVRDALREASAQKDARRR